MALGESHRGLIHDSRKFSDSVMTILSGQSVISRVYTSRFGKGTDRLEPRPWLNESAPQDYCFKNEPRPKGKGGGVATIYSNTLSISQKTGFTYNSFEVMMLHITLSKEK